MTMVGGFDVHRKQITFDYVDDDGLVRWGRIRPATRAVLRGSLRCVRCPRSDGECALEGSRRVRRVCAWSWAAPGGGASWESGEIAGLRGPGKRAKTDRADARLLRTLLLEGRFPESWVPPAHVLEVRTLGRLYCTPDGRAGALAAARPCIHHQSWGAGPRCCRRPAAMRSLLPSCRRPDASTSTRRCGALTS